MANNELGDWYRNIPQLSRYWFTGSVILPLAGKLGIFNVMSMVLNYQLFVYKFQIWRPITALLYYPITPMTGFHYLVNLYLLYTYSTRLETGVFFGKPADYAFMLIFNWLGLVIIGLLSEMMLLMDCMILSVLYVWCQVNRDETVQFWFGTQFKAMYLPWVLVIFNVVIRGNVFSELMGILVGHLYYFLKFKYPQDFGGPALLTTPSFLYRLFPSTAGGIAGFGAMMARQAQGSAARGGRHAWGRGNTLGNN